MDSRLHAEIVAHRAPTGPGPLIASSLRFMHQRHAEPSYAEHIHEPYLQIWTEQEKEWASGLYYSPGFQSARERYIEIARALDTTRPGPERSRLIEEMDKLER